jgi:multidrug efflux pump
VSLSSCKLVQEIQLGDRISPMRHRYALHDADIPELLSWGPKLVEALRTRLERRDVATDQQTGGWQISLVIHRDRAALLGVSLQAVDDTLYSAFRQRQI